MLSSMSLHRTVTRVENGHVRLVEEAGPGPVTQEEAVFRRASAVLMCASYRNQALHVFIRPALVAVALTTAQSDSKEDVFSRFCFLQDLLANEFVFMPGHAAQDFDEGCSDLLRCGALNIYDHTLRVNEQDQDTVVFLNAILEPFIETYQVVFQVLCEEMFQTFTEKRFIPDVRAAIMKLLLSGEVLSYECLSSDTQKNVLAALIRLGAASKSRVAEQLEYRVNQSAVRRIRDMLDASVTSKVPLYSRL